MSGNFPVLIADDSDHDVSFLLRAFAGIRVAVAPTRVRDGESCIETLSGRNVFRLAVIDFYLPKRTGAEVIEILLARGQPVAPIVILTSHISEEQRRQLQAAGIRAIFEKPLDLAGFSQLAANLAALMSD